MKTKRLIMACMAVLALWLSPLPAAADVTHSCTFTLSDLTRHVEQVQDTTLAAYGYLGLYPGTRPGQPMLPSRRVTLAVPYNATAFTVTVTDSASTDTIETLTLKPMPQPGHRNDAGGETLVFDTSVYGTDALFPASPVIVGGDGYYLGEYHQLSLAVYPVRWNPVTGQLRRYTSLSFTVTWTTSEAQARHVIIRSDQQARLDSRTEAQSMVDNPSQVAAFSPPIMVPHRTLPGELIDPDEPGFGGLLTNSVTNYTIITTDSLKHALRKLVALKRQKGYSVTVKTVDEIANDPNLVKGDSVPLGDTCSYINDTAGKMRQFLRNSYKNNNTQYVLMAGKDVPFRKSLYRDSVFDEKFNLWIIRVDSIPTDSYYCDLHTNWHPDSTQRYGYNKLYGENGEKFEFDPELFVGRLMFQSGDDVESYTRKLLRYELNPGNGNTDYLGRSLEVVTDSLSDGITMQTKLDSVYPKADLIIVPKFELTPSAFDIMKQMNDSTYGFACIECHGKPNCLRTNTLNKNQWNKELGIFSLESEKRRPGDSSIDEFDNRQSPGILYAAACTTTPFDTWTEYDVFPPITYNGWNLGQSYTLGADYGGVAYIGNTRISSEFASIGLAYQFMEIMKNGTYNAGRVEALSKHHFTDTINSDALTNNLMGDPEFKIWTHSLTPFNGITVSRTNNSITVSGIDAGDDFAIVSYCNNSSQWRVRAIDGAVTFARVDPNSVVMVCSHNKLPYIAPLVLQNTTIGNSQYVIASDVVAGSNVDTGRTAGDVTISSGVEYEIEYKGSVTLDAGFSVELGASFDVTPSEY